MTQATRYLCILAVWNLSWVAPSFGDDPCSDHDSVVKRLTESLPSVGSLNTRRGEFEARDEGNQYDLQFVADGKSEYHILVSRPDPQEWISTATGIRFGGHGALLLAYDSPGSGGPTCQYILFPAIESGRFKWMRFVGKDGGRVRVADLDSDGDAEIVVSMRPKWVYECDLSSAELGEVRWERIFNIQPRGSKLVDVSKMYPRHYAALARELRIRYDLLSSERRGSSACRKGLEGLIRRAEGLAGKPR